jgi:hypothetical protein
MADSEALDGVAGGSSPLRANKSQLRSENATRADKHRGDFTAGSLLELARPHFTRNLSRKAGGVFYSRNRNINSSLGET